MSQHLTFASLIGISKMHFVLVCPQSGPTKDYIFDKGDGDGRDVYKYFHLVDEFRKNGPGDKTIDYDIYELGAGEYCGQKHTGDGECYFHYDWNSDPEEIYKI
jgi:hypothetical protein